jgi:hypothetical protein
MPIGRHKRVDRVEIAFAAFYTTNVQPTLEWWATPGSAVHSAEAAAVQARLTSAGRRMKAHLSSGLAGSRPRTTASTTHTGTVSPGSSVPSKPPASRLRGASRTMLANPASFLQRTGSRQDCQGASDQARWVFRAPDSQIQSPSLPSAHRQGLPLMSVDTTSGWQLPSQNSNGARPRLGCLRSHSARTVSAWQFTDVSAYGCCCSLDGLPAGCLLHWCLA